MKRSYEESLNPIRDLSGLFAQKETIRCAENGCIPCAYKLCNFDVALDTLFTKKVPNTRPELCPRTSDTHGKEGAFGYKSGMNVLTVGDGDFTFSLGLARIIGPNKSSKLVATSYESLETLIKVYPNIQETLKELRTFNVSIYFEVDATNLKETLPVKNVKFHRISWNFPCTAISNGQDGQNKELVQNQNLIKAFMKQSESYLSPGDGEIHMIHKTKPPYNQWSLEKVALEDYKEKCYVEYKGRIVFDQCLVPPYKPRKALDKKSFPVSDACCYIFGFTGHGKRSQNQFPLTLPTNDEVNDDIIPVTAKLVETVRGIHWVLGSQQDRKRSRKNDKRKVIL